MDQAALNTIVRTIADFKSKVAAVRADEHLSDLGRRTRITELYATTDRKVTELRAGAETSTDARRKKLEGQLFGLDAADPSSVISFRDATDRVAQTSDPQGLGDVMERASTSGDDVLLRAALARAFELAKGIDPGLAYAALVDEYAAQVPAAATAITELRALTSPSSRTNEFNVRMQTSVPRPPEVNDRRPASDVNPNPPRPTPQPYAPPAGVGAPSLPRTFRDRNYGGGG